MGYVIHYFEIQPFIVTLAGMFLARGLCLVISTESIPIDDPLGDQHGAGAGPLLGGWASSSIGAIVALVVVAVAFYVLHYTRFGRSVYAIGGNEQSALLMGLPVGRHEDRRLHRSAASARRSAGLLFTLYIAVRLTRCTPSAWNSTRSPRSSSAARC